jgi:hypothetical protein
MVFGLRTKKAAVYLEGGGEEDATGAKGIFRREDQEGGESAARRRNKQKRVVVVDDAVGAPNDHESPLSPTPLLRRTSFGKSQDGEDKSTRGMAGDASLGATRSVLRMVVDRNNRARLLLFWSIPYSEKFVQLVNYIAFLILFLCYVYVGRTSEGYFLTFSVKQSLVNSSFAPRSTFMDILTPQDWFSWARVILIPTLYPDTYPTGEPLPEEQMQFLLGGVGYRVGQVRLRLLRSAADTCGISHRFEDVLSRCFSPYSSRSADHEDFVLSNGETLPWLPRRQMHMTSYVGVANKQFYPGNGYEVLLPNNAADAQDRLTQLYEGTWFDTQARAVFTEFTIFNPSSGQFAMVMLVAEQTATGEVVPSHYIRTFPILDGWSVIGGSGTAIENTQFLLLVVLGIAVCLRTLTTATQVMRRSGLAREFWTWVEIANLALFWAQFTLGGLLSTWVKTAGRQELERQEGFARTFGAATLYEYLQSILAFNAVITIMMSFRYLSFAHGLNQFQETIRRAWRDLLVICFIVMVIVIGYCITFMLVFGHAVYAFRDFSESMATLFSAVLQGSIETQDQLREVQPYLGPFLVISFLILIVMVILSMLYAIISKAFDDFREEPASNENDPLYYDICRASQQMQGYLKKYIPCARRLLSKDRRAKEIELRDSSTLEDAYADSEDEDAAIEVCDDDVLGDMKPGLAWDDDGFSVPPIENARVELFKQIWLLERRQVELIALLENVILATREMRMPAAGSPPLSP